jgi:DNA (cytosine-5)-methyltransferase 3A
MNVLSLFDGMSCGQIALNSIDIKIDNYYVSEIDKYAIQVTMDNYPNTKQLGSIIDLKKKDLKKLKIDLLIGGSPCQGFSLAGKMKGSVTKEGIEVTSLKQYKKLKKAGFEFEGQSYLFWEYVRVWKIIKPKYFFLENVRVTKKWLPMFNEAMGVEPIMINSALVSAQNRVRYYWSNIPNLTQPKDKGIILKDILENGIATNEMTTKNKSFCLTARYTGAVAWNSIERKQRTMVGVCETIDYDKNSICHHAANAADINGHESIKRVYALTGKSPTINTCTGGNREVKVLNTVTLNEKEIKKLADIEIKNTGKKPKKVYTRYLAKFKDKVLTIPEATKLGYIEVKDGACFDNSNSNSNSKTRRGRDMSKKSNCLTTSHEFMQYTHPTYRKLTPLECERLQTVPEGYTSCVSNSQRYKMLGNGWTIDVISHLFKGLK